MSDNNRQAEKGKLLIAEPLMGDANFDRTVVFLTDHNAEGSVGFIVNRVLDISLDELVLDFPSFNSPVNDGGPVQQDNLFFLHSKGRILSGSEEIIPGIYWGGDFNMLKELISLELIGVNDIRFFMGYSGWSAGQLQAEMDQNAWQVGNASPELIFNKNPKGIWPKVIAGLGGEYPLWQNSPTDPSLN
jgi:putative transcriptional regulator